MLANKLMSALSGGAEDKLYVDDVFSAYTYTDNASIQTITNGIDLAGKGGLVWTKRRGNPASHLLLDTVRGGNNALRTDGVTANLDVTPGITFGSSGYTIDQGQGYLQVNGNSSISWTFRKAPKFFDVVTYTGNGVAGRQIPHALGIAPGMVIVKKLNSSTNSNWVVYHRAVNSTTPHNYFMQLESTAARVSSIGFPWPALPTESAFSVHSDSSVNGNGDTYVAYLFAHDPSADGIIQCGSFTYTSGTLDVDTGWEPQYVLVKHTNNIGGWRIFDSMRGMTATDASDEAVLFANTTAAEALENGLMLTPTGFKIPVASALANTSYQYIYLAIRRPNKPPTTGTEVYNAIARTGANSAATVSGVGFAPDLAVITGKNADYPSTWFDRLRGRYGFVISNSTQAELLQANTLTSFDQDGVSLSNYAFVNESPAPYINHFFRRAPGFFDVVCYAGTGSVLTLNHSLNATPELIIFKNRSTATNWLAYHSFGVSSFLRQLLNADGSTTSFSYGGGAGFNNQPTATQIGLDASAATNAGSTNYVAYLFATLPGISKVGSYTGNGTSQTINCGFTTGARFILIKRTDNTGDWYVWDTARGIVSANDPHLSLNTSAAEVTTDDSVDSNVSGFIVNQVAATNINVSGGSYIYFSVA